MSISLSFSLLAFSLSLQPHRSLSRDFLCLSGFIPLTPSHPLLWRLRPSTTLSHSPIVTDNTGQYLISLILADNLLCERLQAWLTSWYANSKPENLHRHAATSRLLLWRTSWVMVEGHQGCTRHFVYFQYYTSRMTSLGRSLRQIFNMRLYFLILELSDFCTMFSPFHSHRYVCIAIFS